MLTVGYRTSNLTVGLKNGEYLSHTLDTSRDHALDAFDGDSTSCEEESDDDEYTSDEEDDLEDPRHVVKRRIIKRALENVHWVLPTTPSSTRSCTTDSSGESNRSGGIANFSGRGKGRGLGGLHRSSNNGEFPEDEDGEGEGNPVESRAANIAPVLKQPRFACPFHQKYPHRNQKYRSCAGPGFETVHRVK
jgi:hypothetical protein